MRIAKGMGSRRNRRRAIVVVATLAAVIGTLSIGLAALNRTTDGNEVEVASFEAKHLALEWEVAWTATRDDAQTVVKVTDVEDGISVQNGRQKITANSPPTIKETRKPACASGCWQGLAWLEAKSEPGLSKSFPYTNWVAWDLRPHMALNGEATVQFTTHIASDAKDSPNAGIRDWEPYGTWTLTVKPFEFTYKGSAWGGAYEYEEMEAVTSMWTVTKE